MTVVTTQSCHIREVRKRERATSQNITQKKVNTTMDFIQRNTGLQTGKTTERTICYHPTTPQMVQFITILMDAWVKHVPIFKLILSHHQNAITTAYSWKCRLSSLGNGYCQTNGDSHAPKPTLALWVGAPLKMSQEWHQQLQHGASLLGIYCIFTASRKVF